MLDKIKPVLPLAVVTAVFAFVYVELTLNFSFHWVTDGDLGIGLEMPRDFHLIAPIGFVSWALYFAAGTGRSAINMVGIGSIVGSTAALVLMALSGPVADLPDFWGIALIVFILVIVVVVPAGFGEWYYVPAVFCSFACVLTWWFATGADGWNDGGGGVGGGLEALADPSTAGAGAFGGVLSTPYFFVYLSVLATLMVGLAFAVMVTTVVGWVTPAPTTNAEPTVTA